MRIGLGTGSTARHVVDVMAEKLAAGTLKEVVGVPTSRATEAYARESGIPLGALEDVRTLHLTIDGADEIGPGLDLIKGHGGALLWEKLVACASARLVIVADASKLVERLGVKMALPVEVAPFGWTTHLDFLREAGARPELRLAGGRPVVTDGGNYLIDCWFEGGIPDPVGIATTFKSRVGIIETGLFIGMADDAVIADEKGVRVRTRKEGL